MQPVSCYYLLYAVRNPVRFWVGSRHAAVIGSLIYPNIRIVRIYWQILKLEDPGMERTQNHLHVHLNIYTIADSLAATDNPKTLRPLVHPQQGRPRLNISQHLNKVSTVLDWKHPKKASRKRETEKAGVKSKCQACF